MLSEDDLRALVSQIVEPRVESVGAELSKQKIGGRVVGDAHHQFAGSLHAHRSPNTLILESTTSDALIRERDAQDRGGRRELILGLAVQESQEERKLEDARQREGLVTLNLAHHSLVVHYGHTIVAIGVVSRDEVANIVIKLLPRSR